MIKTAAASKKGQKASYVSRVSMTVLTVVLIVLFFFIMMLVSRIQGTARVVNYAGLVRGETQRIIKLEGAGLPQDGMIEDVASFAAFAARLNRSRFRPTRIFRSIMISAFRCPSRYLNTVFLHIFYAFRWQNLQKTAVFAYCIFICLSSWHRFGTVGTSSSFTNTNLNYRSASPNFRRPLWIFAPAPSIAPAIMIAATIIAIAIIILPIRC